MGDCPSVECVPGNYPVISGKLYTYKRGTKMKPEKNQHWKRKGGNEIVLVLDRNPEVVTVFCSSGMKDTDCETFVRDYVCCEPRLIWVEVEQEKSEGLK